MSAQSHATAQATNTTTVDDIDIDHELTDGFAARLIRRKAKQLAARAGFTKADRPDLEQEMTLRVWQRLDQFDPSKAHWNAFMTTIVERHAATLLQRARRTKRFEETPHVSLSELVEDSESGLIELTHTIVPQDKESLTGRYVDTAENQTTLRLEVDEVIESLPDDLRELCELLKFHGVSDAARAMEIPRPTVSSMVTRLRALFAEAGFEDFFPNSSSDDAETR
ncbi:sigma-70 family RNA polymerase sigma factor [Maioricimonas sp. JC845]|uniref:RNA polymerase sigma factor n=1 Tax=Maioricimonas sp. JC845 TaxID=3232138 RepID=UPI003459B466